MITDSSSVYVVDVVKNNTPIVLLSGLKNPTGVAVDNRKGYLFVSESMTREARSTVSRYTMTTSTSNYTDISVDKNSKVIIHNGTFISSLSLNLALQLLYIADSAKKVITVIDYSDSALIATNNVGNSTALFKDSPVVRDLQSVTCGLEKLYWSNGNYDGNGTLVSGDFHPNHNLSSTITIYSSPYDDFADILFKHNELYATVNGTSILRRGHLDKDFFKITDKLNQLSGLAVINGYVYAIDNNGLQVIRKHNSTYYDAPRTFIFNNTVIKNINAITSFKANGAMYFAYSVMGTLTVLAGVFMF